MYSRNPVVLMFYRAHQQYFGTRGPRLTRIKPQKLEQVCQTISQRCRELRTHEGYYFHMLFRWMRRRGKSPKNYQFWFYSGKVALDVFKKEVKRESRVSHPLDGLRREVINSMLMVATLPEMMTKAMVINQLSPFYLAIDPDFYSNPTYRDSISPAKLVTIQNARKHLDSHPDMMNAVLDCFNLGKAG